MSRNEPCSCGSGKKFKKCCGVFIEKILSNTIKLLPIKEIPKFIFDLKKFSTNILILFFFILNVIQVV